MPGFGIVTSRSDHICQFFNSVIGQGADCFIRANINSDDVAVGQIVVVTDDCFEQGDILMGNGQQFPQSIQPDGMSFPETGTIGIAKLLAATCEV